MERNSTLIIRFIFRDFVQIQKFNMAAKAKTRILLAELLSSIT